MWGKFWLVMAVVIGTSMRTFAEEGTRAATAHVPLREKMLTEGEKMIGEFKVTKYSHQTLVDREKGICEVDCSGFIVTILRQTSPAHLKSIPTKHKRPLAEDFYYGFTRPEGEGKARGWEPVPRVDAAKPGDVLTWLKTERQPGDNTGHVMLIAEKPVAEAGEQFRIRILDSTMQGHGDDTRPQGVTGIGSGTIWIVTDAEKRPIGYRWKSPKGMLHQSPIAIGHAVTIKQ